MELRGRWKANDDALFVYFSFSWLVFEVYKGKDELSLSLELGITALQSQDTWKCLGTIWIKNKIINNCSSAVFREVISLLLYNLKDAAPFFFFFLPCLAEVAAPDHLRLVEPKPVLSCLSPELLPPFRPADDEGPAQELPPPPPPPQREPEP